MTLNAWDLQNRVYFRQFGMVPFLLGRPLQQWHPTEEDETHGLPDVMQAGVTPPAVDRTATQAQKDLFEDFITILGTYCPDQFTDTVWCGGRVLLTIRL